MCCSRVNEESSNPSQWEQFLEVDHRYDASWIVNPTVIQL
jgi:hypothetical protein